MSNWPLSGRFIQCLTDHYQGHFQKPSFGVRNLCQSDTYTKLVIGVWHFNQLDTGYGHHDTAAKSYEAEGRDLMLYPFNWCLTDQLCQTPHTGCSVWHILSVRHYVISEQIESRKCPWLSQLDTTQILPDNYQLESDEDLLHLSTVSLGLNSQITSLNNAAFFSLTL